MAGGAGGEFDSLEPLARGPAPRGASPPPLEFIPLAEELGLIEAIGDWVLAELVRQQSEWRGRGPGPRVRGHPSPPRPAWGPPGGKGMAARGRGGGAARRGGVGVAQARPA